VTDILSDVGLAVRRLAKSPLFSVFSILTLALGTGITTTAYSILYGLLWRDPAVVDPSRLLALARPIAWADYGDLREQQTAFSGVAAHAEFSTALTARDTVELIRGEAVSGNYFQTLGLRAPMGRLLQPSDDEPGAPAVMVLSSGLWRSQFGADPGAVGTSVRLARRVFEIVGVAPDRFSGTDVITMRPVGAWITLESARSAAPDLGSPYSRGFNPASRDAGWLTVVARLAPARTRVDAEAETAAIARRLDASAPLRQPPGIGSVNTREPTRDWTLRPALDRSRLAEATEVARVMLAVPALVLLVACTNLANLVLSRGLLRRHEQSIQRALGASRWRLMRAPLVESGVVALLGGIGGTLVTWVLLRWTATAFERTFGSITPVRLEGRLEPQVLAATGVAMLIALAVSGILPALRLTRGNLQRDLRSDVAATGLMRWRGRSNLIALQVAVSVALFLLAALAVRTLPAMRQAPGPGRDLDRAAVVEVPFRWQLPDHERMRLTVYSVLDVTARTQPGLQAAAVAGLMSPKGVTVATPERPSTPMSPGDFAEMVVGTAGIFDALDLPVLTGRPFDLRDRPGTASVAIVNQSLARRLFGQAPAAVGRDVLIRDYTGRVPVAADNSDVETLTVVGVAMDSTLDRHGLPESVIYRPFAQASDPDVAFVARSESLDVPALVSVLRTALRRIDPDIAMRYTGGAQTLFQTQTIAVSLATGVIATLGVIVLVFAAAGLYGVLSHVVYHRTREIGVRMALGATAGRIVTLVIRDGVRPVAEGLFIGLGAAFAIRGLLQSSFSQPISSLDPIAALVPVIPLLAAAAVACYVPARRASRVDPNVALREM
jgi:putative ABC transport system permease protein